jgi:hypothetical protein
LGHRGGSQGAFKCWFQMLLPKVFYIDWVLQLGPKVKSMLIGSKVWVPGFCTKVGYSGWVPSSGFKVGSQTWSQGWVTRLDTKVKVGSKCFSSSISTKVGSYGQVSRSMFIGS